MPRYHINLFNDIDVVDEEGVHAADLAEAKAKAIEGARELMGEHLRTGRPINLRHRIEVADDKGRVLAVIPFRELVTVIDVEPERD
jgi:hypothetical protein